MQYALKNLQNLDHLSKDNIHIWKIQLDKMQDHIDSAFKLLSEDEKERSHKYRIENKRKSYILTRATLKLLLQYYMQDKPYTIYKNHYGKAYIKQSQLYFNISHTKDMSLIAFSKGDEIGIDLESIDCDSSIIDISARYFTKMEHQWMQSIPKAKKMEGFLYCWVRKEAYIKAIGLGLSLPIDSFEVIAKDQVGISNEPFTVQKHFLHSLHISSQHLGAMCIKTPKVDISYFDIDKFI